MKRILNLISATLPLAIIGTLLYAGLFIKPEPVGTPVERPVFERGDRYYGAAFYGDRMVWLAGSQGKVLHSTDLGNSWNVQETPVDLALQDVAAWDDMRAVAVGNDGVVIVTADGGKTWSDAKAPRSQIANKLMRVRTLADGKGWAVGEGGSVLWTSDFGASWQRDDGGEDNAWNDLVVRGNRVVLIGEFGKVRVSSDSGTTWRDVTAPVKSSLMSAHFKDERSGIVVGLNGVVLKTGDGGDSWQVQESGTHEHLYAVTWDGQQWIAAGAKGTLLVGNGAGDSWKATRIDQDDRNWYTAVARQGDHYFLVGSRFVKSERIPL